MKFEIHRCSGFGDKVIEMDLKARVDVNCELKDGRTDRKPDAYVTHTKAGATKKTNFLCLKPYPRVKSFVIEDYAMIRLCSKIYI